MSFWRPLKKKGRFDKKGTDQNVMVVLLATEKYQQDTNTTNTC